MNDDATRHLRTYVDQLLADELMPPIIGIEVTGDEDRPTLLVTVSEPPTADFRARIHAVLASVPYEIRHVPLSDDGSRPGVSYA